MIRLLNYNHALLFIVITLSSCKTETIIQNSVTERFDTDFYRPPRVLLVNMDNASAALMDTLCSFLSTRYSFQVNTTQRPILLHKGNSINTDSALTFLKNLNTYQTEYVVGVTQKNLIRCFPSGKKKKLLGYSELNGYVSVISTYNVSKWRNAKMNFFLRMKKILMHELGHNLGLEHCKSNNVCIMHEQAGSVKNLDREDIIYCNDCRIKLFTNTPYALFY